MEFAVKGSIGARPWTDPCAVVIDAPVNIGSRVVKKGENYDSHK